jgi:hypothetical protein
VDLRDGLVDVEKRKFLPLRGLELRPLGNFCKVRQKVDRRPKDNDFDGWKT